MKLNIKHEGWSAGHDCNVEIPDKFISTVNKILNTGCLFGARLYVTGMVEIFIYDPETKKKVFGMACNSIPIGDVKNPIIIFLEDFEKFFL